MAEEKNRLKDWDRFDKVMRGHLAVPYAELQKELEKERKAKKERAKARNRASFHNSGEVPCTSWIVASGWLLHSPGKDSSIDNIERTPCRCMVKGRHPRGPSTLVSRFRSFLSLRVI